MKKHFFLPAILLALVLSFSSCKTFEMGREMYRNVPMVEKSYTILGTVRIEGKVGKKDVTYDGLLKAARTQYGENVDVVGIKIDKVTKFSGPYLILNAYAIRYTD